MAVALGTLAFATLYNFFGKQVYEADDDIDSERKEIEIHLPGRLPETIEWQLDPHMGWTVFDKAGRLLRRDPIITEEAARPALVNNGIVYSGSLLQGWRVQAFPAGPDRVIVVGYSMQKVYGVLAEIVAAYAWSLPLVVLVASFASWWATGRALKPFRSLAEAMERTQPDRLEQRVPEYGSKDEVQRLASSFNGLLMRLEKSFSQTRRFAADASHELRTPLTIMRSEIERELSQPTLHQSAQFILASLQEEIARLDRITEQLLQLARFDAGQIPLQKEKIDCSALMSDVCEDGELLATAAKITLSVDLEPRLLTSGDKTLLRRLFLNLLDNACKHNAPGGKVACTLRREQESIILRIGNSGRGIPVELRDRVFERFFRADPSRPNTKGHGLGLALCWEIVELHGGALRLTEACREDWTEFEARLPALRLE